MCLRYAPAKCVKFDVSQYFSFNFATANSKFDTFSSYHIVRTQIVKVTASFSLFAQSELVYTKNVLTLFYYSLYFLTPRFFPFGALQTDKILHPLFPEFFFFPLSVRGLTRRRISTGLAELWGGRPIKRGNNYVSRISK